MIGLLNRVGRSIFFKLVLIFIATAVIMATAVGGIVRYVADERPYRGFVGKNMAQYSMYIIHEIGSPPNIEKAQQIADEFRIFIRIKSQNLNWSSLRLPPNTVPDKLHAITGFPNVRGAWSRGRMFIQVTDENAEYLFILGRRGISAGHRPSGLFLLVIAVVFLILGISYAAVRWLFQPLGWLTSGMQRMGRGDLDTTIPIRRYDELGAVAETFNDMSAKIRALVRAKQQLLLDVSHELRSPMTRMKVAAEFIAEEKVRRQINADLREMEAMTAEILESERLTSEKGGLTLEDTDLHKLVSNLVATYGDPPPGIVVHADGSVSAHVDPDRTRTLLRNVIDNALKYSSDQSRPVEVRLKKSNEGVVITVEDFGEGIPERDLALVFEPFYRVDKSRGRKTGGYGLGLNLCRKIMEAHGGTIHVQSRVGEGTRFTMRFPNR